MAKVYRVEFEVRPLSPINPSFPVDMLRYDSCYPESQESTGKMYFERGVVREEVPVVKLVHTSHGDKKWQPTRDRWKSFGWEVISVRVREQY